MLLSAGLGRHDLNSAGCGEFGIALGSGPRGLGFESRHSDHVVADCISFATTFFKSSLTHYVAPPFRSETRFAGLRRE